MIKFCFLSVFASLLTLFGCSAPAPHPSTLRPKCVTPELVEDCPCKKVVPNKTPELLQACPEDRAPELYQ